MSWKTGARKLCPPLLWDGLSKIKKSIHQEPQLNLVKPNAVIGKNSEVYAHIDKRDNGKGTVTIGRDCVLHGLLVTERDTSQLIIGDNVFINGATIIDCVQEIRIDEDVMISYHCVIADSDNHNIRYSVRRDDLRKWREKRYEWELAKTAPIHICRGAWLGAYSIVLKGVRVGVGAIVGAGAVVTRNVPDYAVVVGNPAKVVRILPEDER